MIQDICVVSDSKHEFWVRCSNSTELMRANSFTQKEPETVKWLMNEIRPDSVFWDIGANIGLFSLYAASIQPNAKILAFEPAAHNYASLCENIMVNKFNNVRPYSVALGMAGMCFVDLHLSKMEAGSAIHNIGERSPWATADAVFRQPCVSVSVDELIEQYNFPSPTIMKIDVDGVELSILKTASVALDSVKTLLVELDAFDENELRAAKEILEEREFRLHESSTREKTINKKLPRNYIWKK